MSEDRSILKGLKAGQRIDQFRIVRKLGQGGMSEVYLARDTSLGRKVALKIVRTEFAGSPKRLQLFLNEARLTAKFSHPHIITIHTVGEFEGYPYLALEHLEGQTLRQRMREGPMSAPETMRIGLAIAQALEEAHHHGVLHRDLKPANVIITKDGRLRVLDFGISKIIEDSIHPPAPTQELAVEINGEETAFGEIKGTPNYIAPERWLGEKATGGSDVWALGVILFQALTQTHPFLDKDKSMEDIARRIVLASPPPILPSELTVPPKLAVLVTSMLDREPSRRPTAKQVVEELLGLLQRKRPQSLENRSPFRGLMPFTERHADLFFGRSAEIEMALERLRHEPILPIVGPSGAGKSSFVSAGIVPRLRELDQWIVLKSRPGTNPFGALGSVIEAAWRGGLESRTSPWSATAPKFFMQSTDATCPPKTVETELLRSGKTDLLDSELTIIDSTARSQVLARGKDKLVEHSSEASSDRDSSPADYDRKLSESPATLLLELQALADETRGKVLLFVDQLEELYTHEHESELRRAYMEAISRAADDPSGPVRVVFTLREDFLSRVADSPAARESLSHIMVLREPEEETLLEVVTKPVELTGYSYEDERLPEEMIDAVRGAPASLPVLQFACSQLWNRRDTEQRLLTRVAYEAMGGVEGALAYKADELLAGLSEVQQKVMRQLLLRLVTPDGTRRVISSQELLDSLDSSAAFILDRLTAGRMVVSRRGVGQQNTGAELELVHDSLIHSWKPLVRWLEQSREEVVFLDEVSRAAELWVSRGRLREEVWTGRALEEALAKLERCEAVPNRVIDFLEAGDQQKRARARGRRKIVFAGFSVLLAAIAVLVFIIREVNLQREIAVTERERQQLAHANALREGARAAYIKGDFLEARSKLRCSLEVRDSAQARALWWLLENEPLVWSKSLDSAVNRASVSPDNRLLAVSSGTINIYDTKTLERRILSGHKREVVGLDFSPDGRYLASGSMDRDIHLWDLRENTVKVLKGHTRSASAVAFSPDGKRLATGSHDKTLKIWDIESGSLLRTLQVDSRVFGLRFAPDGRSIISLYKDIRFWNAQSYELERVITEPGMLMMSAVFSPDGKLMAYGGSDGVLVVQDLESQQERARISRDIGDVRSLSFSSNSDLLAVSTHDGRILVFETKNWSLFRQFQHSETIVGSVSFLSEGKQLVSTGTDNTVKLWKMDAQSLQKECVGHGSRIYGLAFAPNGKNIATGSDFDGELRIWDIASSQSSRRIRGHSAGIKDISFRSSGDLLAAGINDGSIAIYSFPEGRLIKTLLGHANRVSRTLFSSDGKQLVSSSFDKTIAFWDLESLTLHKSFATESIVKAIDVDPTGRLLASVCEDNVQVRDFETGRILRSFVGHTGLIWDTAFSHDGKSLYSSSSDHTLRRYLLSNTSIEGEVIARHSGTIYWFDVTQKTEDIIGTPSADGTAKIWKVDSGEVITLKGHQKEVNTLRFSPDGTRVATVSDDTTLRLWDAATGRPLWRAPLMLEENLLLLTEQGWIDFGNDREPSLLTKRWHKAVHARGKLASATVDGETLCLVSFGDELEIWDLPNDERSFQIKQSGIQQVLSIRRGCLIRSAGILTLMKATGDSVTLGKQAEAMSRLGDSVLFLESDKVHLLDQDGNEHDAFNATAGATALTQVGEALALGFPDGRIEIWRRDNGSSERVFICRDAEGYPVTTIIPGPPGTIIAGFAHGTIGIWSLDTGERLYSYRLHGPVIHLVHRDQALLAATELGSRVRLDLSMFYIEYCDLMERVWSSVPWIWQEGRARFRERPRDHFCAQRSDE